MIIGLQSECFSDCRLLLKKKYVTALAGDPVECVTHIEQEFDGRLPRRVRNVGEPGGRNRSDDRGLTQASVGLLEIGLEYVSQLPETLAARIDEFTQIGKTTTGHRAPVAKDSFLQLLGQLRRPSNDASVHQAQHDFDVFAGKTPSLSHGAHTVIEGDTRIPDRIPQCVGHCRCATGVGAMEQQQIKIASGRQLGTSVTAHRHQRDIRTRGGVSRREEITQPVVGEPGERSPSSPAKWPGTTDELASRGLEVGGHLDRF